MTGLAGSLNKFVPRNFANIKILNALKIKQIYIYNISLILVIVFALLRILFKIND